MAVTHAGELFAAPAADLYLVQDGDVSALMQSGQFSLMLVKNPVSQLAAVVAMVGEVQWPVGHDSSVVRKEEASFTFTLPGPLIYDLVLQSPSADLQKLEHILEEYSDCQKPAEKQTLQNVDSALCMEQLRPRSSSESRKRTVIDITNSQMMGRMLRARRMSAVAKVFSKSLERGAIDVASHVESMDTAVAPPSQISPILALASVNAVAKVVEAVETGGRTLLESAGSAAAGVTFEDRKHRQSDANASSSLNLRNLINSGWTLNKLGLRMIFRVITASMAIHSSRSSSGGSSRSGSSSSSEFRRLLSSSSSSSSLSSKSPSTPSYVQGSGTAEGTSSALSFQQAAAMAGTAMSSPLPVPPPPPLFSQNAPRLRPAHSHMPPPSGPLPPMVGGSPSQTGMAFSDSPASTPIRIYKPRPKPAAPAAVAPPLPVFVPRPPRFQPPPKG